jgi:NAD(P)-dependent dehydrogenase (short-subunit alcohol dehydrogenase family)
MQEQNVETVQRPPQHQYRQPGLEEEMQPAPHSEGREYHPANKLAGKVALITGGDSGIGRAVATLFAKEGADVAVAYLDEHVDANETKARIEALGRRCLLLSGDVGDEKFCTAAVASTIEMFTRLDVLVNNAAEQHPQESLLDVSAEQLERTFRTNVFSYFFMARAALPHLKSGATIINTTSVTAYRGSAKLLDYAATKGAIVAFTRSLAQSLVKRDIRVNGVAPGPIWTPLIASTFPADKVSKFGSDVPMERAGEPDEVAPCYVFLASSDSSYMSGQVLHPNGGEVVNA